MLSVTVHIVRTVEEIREYSKEYGTFRYQYTSNYKTAALSYNCICPACLQPIACTYNDETNCITITEENVMEGLL